jgi:hypothetical protein
MQTYFSTDYAQINYDAESNAIVFIWLTPPSYDEFRNSMEQIIEAEQYFKTGKLIVDTNQQGTIHPDNQQWVAKDWTKRAIEKGHTHAAIIMPKDIFAILSIDDMMAQVNGIIVGYFNNTEEAIEWIKQA